MFQVIALKTNVSAASLSLFVPQERRQRNRKGILFHLWRRYSSLVVLASETNPRMWSDVVRGAFDVNDDNVSSGTS